MPRSPLRVMLASHAAPLMPTTVAPVLAIVIGVALVAAARPAPAETIVTILPALESEAPGGPGTSIVLTPDIPLRIDVSFFNQSDAAIVLPLGWQEWFTVGVAGSCSGLGARREDTEEGREALASFLVSHPGSAAVVFDATDAVHEIGPRQEYRTALSLYFDSPGDFAVVVRFHPPAGGGTVAGFRPAVVKVGEPPTVICGSVVTRFTDLQQARKLRWDGSRAFGAGDMDAAVAMFSEAHALAPGSTQLELEFAWVLDKAGDLAGAARHFGHAVSRYRRTRQDPFGNLETDVGVEKSRQRLKMMEEATRKADR